MEVNADPVQVSPNDNSDFDYHFQGQFVTTGANPTITVMFKPGSFGDNDGATNQTQYASFTLFNSTTQQSTQTVTLSGNPTGGTVVLGVSRPDTRPSRHDQHPLRQQRPARSRRCSTPSSARATRR